MQGGRGLGGPGGAAARSPSKSRRVAAGLSRFFFNPRGPAFEAAAATAAPVSATSGEDDFGNTADIDASKLAVHKYSLRFVHKDSGEPQHFLADRFGVRNAKRFLIPLRVVGFLFALVNFILVLYDIKRFSGVDDTRLRNTLIIRLMIVLPLAAALLVFTWTRWYLRYTQWIVVPITALGFCLIAFAVVSRAPGYGTLALLIVFMFSFSPLSVWLSTVAAACLIIAFGVAIGVKIPVWAAEDAVAAAVAAATNSTAAASSSSSSDLDGGAGLVNIIGVLVVFYVLVGFIGHNLELKLKQAFLDEYRLKMETRRLRTERALSSSLLHSMLPAIIISELQAGRSLIADSHEEVTVLFCELHIDTQAYPAHTTVAVLNLVYSTFDALVDVCGVHKVETVGEVYLCVAGAPEKKPHHAQAAAEMAIGMMQSLNAVREQVRELTGIPPEDIQIRIGLNSGPVAAGIVGIKNPRYKLIGDTVNTASRMESTCKFGRIQVSSACRDVLVNTCPGQYVITERGNIAVKGKGFMRTYWLEGKAGEPPVAPVDGAAADELLQSSLIAWAAQHGDSSGGARGAASSTALTLRQGNSSPRAGSASSSSGSSSGAGSLDDLGLGRGGGTVPLVALSRTGLSGRRDSGMTGGGGDSGRGGSSMSAESSSGAPSTGRTSGEPLPSTGRPSGGGGMSLLARKMMDIAARAGAAGGGGGGPVLTAASVAAAAAGSEASASTTAVMSLVANVARRQALVEGAAAAAAAGGGVTSTAGGGGSGATPRAKSRAGAILMSAYRLSKLGGGAADGDGSRTFSSAASVGQPAGAAGGAGGGGSTASYAAAAGSGMLASGASTTASAQPTRTDGGGGDTADVIALLSPRMRGILGDVTSTFSSAARKAQMRRIASGLKAAASAASMATVSTGGGDTPSSTVALNTRDEDGGGVTPGNRRGSGPVSTTDSAAGILVGASELYDVESGGGGASGGVGGGGRLSGLPEGGPVDEGSATPRGAPDGSGHENDGAGDDNDDDIDDAAATEDDNGGEDNDEEDVGAASTAALQEEDAMGRFFDLVNTEGRRKHRSKSVSSLASDGPGGSGIGGGGASSLLFDLGAPDDVDPDDDEELDADEEDLVRKKAARRRASMAKAGGRRKWSDDDANGSGTTPAPPRRGSIFASMRGLVGFDAEPAPPSPVPASFSSGPGSPTPDTVAAVRIAALARRVSAVASMRSLPADAFDLPDEDGDAAGGSGAAFGGPRDRRGSVGGSGSGYYGSTTGGSSTGSRPSFASKLKLGISRAVLGGGGGGGSGSRGKETPELRGGKGTDPPSFSLDSPAPPSLSRLPRTRTPAPIAFALEAAEEGTGKGGSGIYAPDPRVPVIVPPRSGSEASGPASVRSPGGAFFRSPNARVSPEELLVPVQPPPQQPAPGTESSSVEALPTPASGPAAIVVHGGSSSGPNPRNTAVAPAPAPVAASTTVVRRVTSNASSSSASSGLGSPRPAAGGPIVVRSTGASKLRTSTRRASGLDPAAFAAASTPLPPPPPASFWVRCKARLKPGDTLTSRIRWADRLSLCLNRPMLTGEAAKLDTSYRREMLPGWIRFMRVSSVLLIVVAALFAIQDAVKFRDDTSAGLTNAKAATVWKDVSIARYGVLVPIVVVYLPLTYLRYFRKSWWFSQLTTGLVVFGVGLALIAVSIVGQDPGYGVLALYIVYCLNFSLLALAFRTLVLGLLIVSYGFGVYYLTPALYPSFDTSKSSSFTLLYLVTFFVGELCPVLLREYAVRQNFFRKFRIDIERRRLADEEARSNKLLENLLPAVIVPRLRSAQRDLIVDTFEEATILWTDMKGFTDFSSTRQPIEIVAFLNAMFSTFDRILDKYGVRKVEVLGDAFFCCAGVPVPVEDHAERCVNAAFEMQAHMAILRQFANADISMRVGVNTGSVIAGVVGLKDPRYHLFGATVPYANAMESNGVPGCIHVSEACAKKLQARQAERARAFVRYVWRVVLQRGPSYWREQVLATVTRRGSGSSSSVPLTQPSRRRGSSTASVDSTDWASSVGWHPAEEAAEAAAIEALLDSYGHSSVGAYPVIDPLLLDEYQKYVVRRRAALGASMVAAEAVVGGGGSKRRGRGGVASTRRRASLASTGGGGSSGDEGHSPGVRPGTADSLESSGSGLGTPRGDRRGSAYEGVQGFSTPSSSGGVLNAPKLLVDAGPRVSAPRRRASVTGPAIGASNGVVASPRRASVSSVPAEPPAAMSGVSGAGDGGTGLYDLIGPSPGRNSGAGSNRSLGGGAGGGGGSSSRGRPPPVSRIRESGPAAVRGQVQLWQGGGASRTFLGWDILVDTVQGGTLYTCLPSVYIPRAPALDADASRALVPAGSGSGAATVNFGPATLASVDAGIGGSGAVAAAAAKPPATSGDALDALLTGGPSGGPRGSSRPGASASGAPIIASSSTLVSVDAGVPRSSALSKTGRTALGGGGGGGGEQPATAGAPPPSSSLSRPASTATLSPSASALRIVIPGMSKRSSPSLAPLVLTDASPPQLTPSAAAASAPLPIPSRPRNALGLFEPADPCAFFGRGGGFFGFTERTAEVKGWGVRTTYFVTRADPPFIPELAEALSAFARDLEAWATATLLAEDDGTGPAH